YRLTGDLLQYHKGLSRLGVRDDPGPSDAIDVLHELSREWGSKNVPLDDETRAVWQGAWALLQEHLELGTIGDGALSSLRSTKCVCDQENLLSLPAHILFRNDQWLSLRFERFLGSTLIEKDVDTWRALRGAGVRHLTEVVEVDLHHKVVTGDAAD